MPLPRWLARFNRRWTNPTAMKLLGRRLPVVVHRGRVTGRVYRTPVAVFCRGDRIIVPLTYGPTTEWARNVVHDGGCLIERRRSDVDTVAPRIVGPPESAAIVAELPSVVRFGLRRLGCDHVLVARAITAS